MSEREAEAVRVLIEAKDAFRADPSEENVARKQEAVRVVEAIRQEEREGRPGTSVGGDAFVSNGQEG